MGECEDHDVQQASPAAIAEHGIRQAKTGEDHEERHGHIRDHLAEDEGGLAHRGHVDLLDGAAFLLRDDVQGRKEAAHHRDGDHDKRRDHESLVVQGRVVEIAFPGVETGSGGTALGFRPRNRGDIFSDKGVEVLGADASPGAVDGVDLDPDGKRVVGASVRLKVAGESGGDGKNGVSAAAVHDSLRV